MFLSKYCVIAVKVMYKIVSYCLRIFKHLFLTYHLGHMLRHFLLILLSIVLFYKKYQADNLD